jgi:uncharacterized protein (TIGR02246 family)
MSDPYGLFLATHWMEALCEGDIAALLAMYDTNAVLVPTFSNDIVQGHDELQGYFEDFSGSRPNLCGEVHGEISQNLHDGHRAVSGTYTFTWGEDPENLESDDARYTFVIQEGAGEWVIHTHHSSEFPYPS